MSKFQFVVCIVVAAASGALFREGSFQSVSPVQAADAPLQQGPQSSCDVAVLDVSKVFKMHKPFADFMSKLKAKLAEIEKEATARQAEIIKLQTRLQGFQTGTFEYNALQSEIDRRRSDYEVWVPLRRSPDTSEETKVYADTYERMVEQTEKIARAKRIRMVLNFRSDLIDRTKRDAVMQGVTRAVVFQDALDITDAVIAALNAQD